jgi:serine protease Do
MSGIRLLFIVLISSFLGGLVAVFFSGRSIKNPKPAYDSFETYQQKNYPFKISDSALAVPAGLNFVQAAQIVRPAVVHVKTFYGPAGRLNKFQDEMDPLELPQEFNDHSEQSPEASGSGVIIAGDGYIVTNQHVVQDAAKVEVVLDDKRSYVATIVGTDPNTDLALLKIDEVNLPFVRFGNSDLVNIGEWVLAIGNPFDLTSTVTAGIVSAKARNINILRTRSNMQVESFIQTDAAVNPGNSGGALVNLKGELIGVNTAIASNNGSFTGYAFAIPVTIVKKVTDDLLKYGNVQRAILGVVIRDITAELAKEKSIERIQGVYIESVNAGSAAADAKLKSGDIILKINNTEVNSSSELVEIVARNRPGDKIKVTFKRGSEVITLNVKLKSKQGDTKIRRREEQRIVKDKFLKAELQSIGSEDKDALDIKNGVKVLSVEDGKLSDAGIKDGFVITHIDRKPVSTPEQVGTMLQNVKGGVLIEGIYSDGAKAYYGFGK